MDWEQSEENSGYSRINGMDPYADWLLGPGFADFVGPGGNEDTLIPFIVAPLSEEAVTNIPMPDEEIQDDVPDTNILMQIGASKLPLLVLDLYTREDLRSRRYVAAFARKSFFDQLADVKTGLFKILREAPKQIKLGIPLPPASLPDWKPEEPKSIRSAARIAPPVARPRGGWPPDTVVVGVIDDGIAFAHDRFRARNGTTRIQYFWQQDGTFERALPSTVPLGREIWKSDLGQRTGIDSLLRQCTDGAGLVDEDAVYQRAGLIDFASPGHKSAAWTLAHGTHVLDLAAGYPMGNAPDNRPIIAVQLPSVTTADTSGASLEFHVKIALDYILDRAQRLAGNGPQLPVVVNFSYGMFAGPHDGTSSLEQSIDQWISRSAATRGGAPLSVVLPSGNGHLARCHSEIEFRGKRPKPPLRWRVQPDDLTPSQMEIWMPHRGDTEPFGPSRVSIRIETPEGLLSQELKETHSATIRLRDNNTVIAEARYTFQPLPTARGVFRISMQPSARLYPPAPPAQADQVAPSGVWKVHVTNTGLPRNKTIEAWIQRDDVVRSYPRRGRQSYFDMPCYLRFDEVTGNWVQADHEEDPRLPLCSVKRRGMINAIATGFEATVIAGIYGKELTPARYSAGGPTTPNRDRQAHRIGPDAAAVSDDSIAHPGLLAAGSHSGSAVVMSGTSVATPQITREVANMLGTPAIGDRHAVARLAGAREIAHPQWPAQSEIRTGEGRILRRVNGRRVWTRMPRYEED